MPCGSVLLFRFSSSASASSFEDRRRNVLGGINVSPVGLLNSPSTETIISRPEDAVQFVHRDEKASGSVLFPRQRRTFPCAAIGHYGGGACYYSKPPWMSNSSNLRAPNSSQHAIFNTNNQPCRPYSDSSTDAGTNGADRPFFTNSSQQF